MSERWLIVADDLTGAADSAIAFATRGLRTRVLLHEEWLSTGDTAVVAIDAHTRRAAPAEAAARHERLLRSFGASGDSVFKKIDSTLRGHPAAEIAALRSVLAERQSTAAVLAPAFPAMGRTVRDGRVFVRGEPLERSENWQRERPYANADLADILASAGMSSVKLPLALVRAGPVALRDELRSIAAAGSIAVCDAENDEDLDFIAGAARTTATGLLIGTAGLAHAVARTLPAAKRNAVRVAPSAAGALVAVGSMTGVSREAARQLAASPGVLYLPIDPAALLAVPRDRGLADACEGAIDALHECVDVLAEIVAPGDPDLAQGPILARSLAEALAPVMTAASGIAVTGGDTARALLSRHHVSEIELLDEIEDGVCLGVAHRGVVLPVITRSGSFGEGRTLVRALEKLRAIRSSGLVA